MYAAGSGNGPIAVARRPNDAGLTGHAQFGGHPAEHDVELQQRRLFNAVKQRAYLEDGARYAFRAQEHYGQPDLRRPGEPPPLAARGNGRHEEPSRDYGRSRETDIHAAAPPDAYQERYAPWSPEHRGGPRIEYTPQSIPAQRVRPGVEQGPPRLSGATSYAQDVPPPHPSYGAIPSHGDTSSRYSMQTTYATQPSSYAARDDVPQNRRSDLPPRRDVPGSANYRYDGRPSLQSEGMLRARNIATGGSSAPAYPPGRGIAPSIRASPPPPHPSEAHGPARMRMTSRIQSSQPSPSARGPGTNLPDSADEASDRLHEYLFDYFERAGFRTTAAALQSELPHRAFSADGPPRPQPAHRSTAEERAAMYRPGAAPFAAAMSQAPSPLSSTMRPPSRPAATPSSATTTTHFGFDDDARRSSDVSSWGTPSSGSAQLPHVPYPREPSAPGSGGFPAQSRSNVDHGFLYEWWNIFWDVYSAQAHAQARTQGSQHHSASGTVHVATQPRRSGENRDRDDSSSHEAFLTETQASYRYGEDHPTRPPIPLRRGSESHAAVSLARSLSSSLPSRMQESGRKDAGRGSGVPAQADGRENRVEAMPTTGPSPRSDTQHSSHPAVRGDRPQGNGSMLQAGRLIERPEDVRVAASPFTAGASADSAAPSFSASALQYNPGQLQQTADAYRRYRASLVAKQATQLEMAKRQLSDLGGGENPANSAQAVGRPAAVAGVAPVQRGSMPPPATSSKRSSTTSTPQARNATLPPKNTVASGSTSAHPSIGAEPPLESMLGKRSRDGLNESVVEPMRRNRLRADRPGSPDQAGSAAPRPAVQQSSFRPGSSDSDHAATSTPTDVEPDLTASQNASHRPKTDRRGHPSASSSVGEISMDQLNALLSTTTDSPVNLNLSSRQGIAGLDDAAFDYDEFLSSFAGGFANYDPTSRAFDVNS